MNQKGGEISEPDDGQSPCIMLPKGWDIGPGGYKVQGLETG